MAKTILGERDRKRHTRKVWFVVKNQKRVERDNRKGRVYQKGQMQKVPRRGNVNGKWEWTGDGFGLKEHK